MVLQLHKLRLLFVLLLLLVSVLEALLSSYNGLQSPSYLLL
jgi:hypothetical protein